MYKFINVFNQKPKRFGFNINSMEKNKFIYDNIQVD